MRGQDCRAFAKIPAASRKKSARPALYKSDRRLQAGSLPLAVLNAIGFGIYGLTHTEPRAVASRPGVVRFRVDLATHRYSVFLIGAGDAETPIGKDLALPKKIRRLTSLDTLVLVVDTGTLEACRES